MKIRVTQTELHALLSKALGMEVTGVVISKGHKAAVEKFLEAMAKELGVATILPHGFSAEQKIPAIKALRTVTTGVGMWGGAAMYGLAEAKWAVENWPRFIKEFTRLGHVPKLGGQIFSVEGPTFS
jgi:ribosomal protein L7/L12